jgi:hypothetical protein
MLGKRNGKRQPKPKGGYPRVLGDSFDQQTAARMIRIFSSAENLRRVFRLISRTIESGDGFFLVLMHSSKRGFSIRKPSLKKNHEWSEFA